MDQLMQSILGLDRTVLIGAAALVLVVCIVVIFGIVKLMNRKNQILHAAKTGELQAEGLIEEKADDSDLSLDLNAGLDEINEFATEPKSLYDVDSTDTADADAVDTDTEAIVDTVDAVDVDTVDDSQEETDQLLAEGFKLDDEDDEEDEIDEFDPPTVSDTISNTVFNTVSNEVKEDVSVKDGELDTTEHIALSMDRVDSLLGDIKDTFGVNEDSDDAKTVNDSDTVEEYTADAESIDVVDVESYVNELSRYSDDAEEDNSEDDIDESHVDTEYSQHESYLEEVHLQQDSIDEIDSVNNIEDADDTNNVENIDDAEDINNIEDVIDYGELFDFPSKIDVEALKHSA